MARWINALWNNRNECMRQLNFTNSDWLEYKDLRHKYVKINVKTLIQAYITNIISSFNNNKLFWKHIKAKQQDTTEISYYLKRS